MQIQQASIMYSVDSISDLHWSLKEEWWKIVFILSVPEEFTISDIFIQNEFWGLNFTWMLVNLVGKLHKIVSFINDYTVLERRYAMFHFFCICNVFEHLGYIVKALNIINEFHRQ